MSETQQPSTAGASELLPCPWCGDVADLNGNEHNGFRVGCYRNPDCNPSPETTTYIAKEAAVYAWNHRPGMQRLRDAVEKGAAALSLHSCGKDDCEGKKCVAHRALVAAAAMLRVVLPGSGGEETATRKEGK